MTRGLQGFLEELLGRSRVSLSGKQEVNRGAGGIDRTLDKRTDYGKVRQGFTFCTNNLISWLIGDMTKCTILSELSIGL
jgi:hypothetical protein